MTVSSSRPRARDADFGRITDEGIERLRARIGVEVPKEPLLHVFNEHATTDTIRHFANCYGDDNPLYTDPEYASTTRWSGMIAPPTFLTTTGVSAAPPLSGEQRERGGGALAGVHAYWSGNAIGWFAPVVPGDRLVERRFLHSFDIKQSAFTGGRSVVERHRSAFEDAGERVVAHWDRIMVRAERESAKRTGRYTAIERPQWTAEQIDEVERALDAETVRGAEPRWAEDVRAGDELGPYLRGPLTLSDIIAWYQGSGRWELHPYRLARRNRRRHPGFFTRNGFGAHEPVMRCHWDDAYAQETGNPYAYDFGQLRTAWCVHLVTDWMGDDGWLWALENRLRRFNYIGDLTTVRGRVTATLVVDGRHVAEIEIHCTNQRGEDTAPGRVLVLLPSRADGPVRLPEPEEQMPWSTVDAGETAAGAEGSA
jgi:acyl dehydratase